LASSSAWKRKFSSRTTPGAPARAIASLAGSPIQSLANTTVVPSSDDSRSATGCSENSGFGLPFGRPRCDARMAVAPCSSAYLMVGSDDWMRVSSVICPFLIGTLKSTRMNTRRPFRFRSVIERLAIPYRPLPFM
jgi:hypothetical protein